MLLLLKEEGGTASTVHCESDSEEGPSSSQVSGDREMINGFMNVLGLCDNFNSHESVQLLY